MKFKLVTKQQILRCKQCGENPTIEVTMEMKSAWGGVPVESYFARVFCTHQNKAGIAPYETSSPSYAGMKKQHALSYTLSTWNTYYGKK